MKLRETYNQENIFLNYTIMSEGIGGLRAPKGCHCTPSIAQSFDYYGSVPIETAQHSFSDEKILPVNGTNNGPYEFHLDSVGDSFICLNSILMYCKAKIEYAHPDQEDGLPDEAAPVNNTLGSLWREIETRVNNVPINPNSSYNTAYKAYIETILSHDDSINHAADGGLFAMDDAGRFNDATDANRGFAERRDRTEQAREFDMCGVVCSDFLRSNNHLAPGNRLTLKFTRSSDSFLLQTESDKQHKFVILEVALFIRRIHLRPEVMKTVLKPNQTQKYLSTYTEIKEFPLSAGIQQFATKLYTGEHIPKQVIIFQADTTAQLGHPRLNPYRFFHHYLNHINLKINGASVPQEPLTPNFRRQLYMREYHHLFSNTGKNRVNAGNCISFDCFGDGGAIFPFDLTPDQCNGHHVHGGVDGCLELQMKWAEPLTTAITVMVYAVFDQVVLIKPDSPTPEVEIF